ncbi:hypothetical protein [Cryptosporangium phraense]|uniref:Uncharacterized protein n=1 Tax=Cryptosporangium phraense TaxID=2593070 RepID=A0A545ASL3_9ACTN|nr:hypothetical protein [Cryptosporangium phraense]TQS44327.1 hypothetical protein FL583_15455 [Cryptosporangium phraense]
MTAEVFDLNPLLHPSWCDRTHGVADDCGQPWVPHSATFEVPIDDTDRSAVVWVDSCEDSAPRLRVGFDRPDCNGEIFRYDGMPVGGDMEMAEAAALAVALQRATDAVAGRVA